MMKRMNTRKYIYAVLLLVGMSLGLSLPAQAEPEALSLAGKWSFRLDPSNVGEAEHWFNETLPDSFVLPGSTDENGYGSSVTGDDTLKLSRIHKYVGAAWYQRKVTIAKGWSNKRVVLLLERCGWETRVWVDGVEVDSAQNSLCVPHEHDLSKVLMPGEHTITMRVDNTVKINIGHSQSSWLFTHAVTEETQTNWNGVIGRIELIATDPVWVDTVQVYSDVAAGTARVEVTIGNRPGTKASGALRLRAELSTGGTPIERVVPFKTSGVETIVEATLEMGEFSTWDEFSPALYNLTVSLATKGGHKKYRDLAETTFGMRDFAVDGQHFTMNGRRVYLRGTLDCCIWPLTGYPAMDVAAWTDYLQTLKDYGHNHVRFHSWCPPEAAFTAADQLGIMLQAEGPLWDGYGDMSNTPGLVPFMTAEIDRILDTYGNHPSFCLFSTGNELGKGTDPFLGPSVEHNRNKDPRHLYTATTHPYDAARNDDYFAAASTDRGTIRRVKAGPNGWATDSDHSANLTGIDRPVISHEIGQYCMFANFDEIKKYTGTLRARNMEVFRDSLDAHHMLDQAEAFRVATGEFIERLYKEEYEKMLRTPNSAGFQSLGVYDFPGQGSSYIGLLDAFRDSKGIITPEEYRRFHDATVLLLKMPKREWTDAEIFTADIVVSHYGPTHLSSLTVDWKLVDDQGAVQASGTLLAANTPTGGITALGSLNIPLASLDAGAKYTIELSASSPAVRNEWDIWVLSDSTTAPPEGDVQVFADWDDGVSAALEAGEKVLLLTNPMRVDTPISGCFTPVFWNMRLFANQPGTMSILCDPDHPAFAGFPTDSHSDWQWNDLLQNYQPMLLDDTPASYRPLVQIIDDYGRNHKLGAVIECTVGSGKLLVSSIDLRTNMDNRPTARHLLRSLLDYMNTPAFAPTTSLEESYLESMLTATAVLDNGAPEHPERAEIDIDAAANAPMGGSLWSQAQDEAIKLSSNFNYTVASAQCWRDAQGAAWFGGAPEIEITCPVGFEGTVYYHFHDWNAKDRRAHVYFEGRDMGPIGNHSGDGLWAAFTVNASNTADGRIRLCTQLTSGPNVMIARIVLIPSS